MRQYLIIGGSGGIGSAIVSNLLNEGHSVIATYNTHPGDDQDRLRWIQYEAPDAKIDFVPEELDGVAYCPGTINLMPFHRISSEAFVDDYKVQVLGAIQVMKASKEALLSRNGSVVLFSTVAASKGYTFHSQVATSKGAIEGLTKALAAEWAPGIRVNAIAPSITDTSLAKRLLSNDAKREASAARHPLKRIGKPEDIANAASYLLQEESSWITGQVIPVDGGIGTINM